MTLRAPAMLAVSAALLHAPIPVRRRAPSRLPMLGPSRVQATALASLGRLSPPLGIRPSEAFAHGGRRSYTLGARFIVPLTPNCFQIYGLAGPSSLGGRTPLPRDFPMY